MSQGEEGGEGGGNEVYLGLPCGRQKPLLAEVCHSFLNYCLDCRNEGWTISAFHNVFIEDW